MRKHHADTRSPLIAFFCLAAAACSGGSGCPTGDGGLTRQPITRGPGDFLATDPATPGALLEHPLGSGARSRRFIVDPNQGGGANALGYTGFSWGRLVNVLDLDASGRSHLIHHDFVIDPDLASDGQNFLLTLDQATSEMQLVILHPADSAEFRSAFQDTGTLPRIDAGLVPILDVGSPPFSTVPRNASIVVQFDDLVDETTLDATTLRILTGSPAMVPFEARLTMDQNHGAVVSVAGAPLRFYSTRAIVDPAVSMADATMTSPPLPLNPTGLPAATNATDSNLMLRLPTRINASAGQLQVLTTAAGRPIDAAANGSFDPTSPTRDVLRNARSGGAPGDAFNGFLADDEPPRIIGSSPANIGAAPVQQALPDEFTLPSVTFLGTTCAYTPAVGDAISQPGVIAEIVVPGTLAGQTLSGVEVRLVAWPASWPGPGEWVNVGAGAAGVDSVFPTSQPNECFVRVTPTPSGFPNLPTAGVQPSSTFRVRFGEPIDGAALQVGTSVLAARSAILPDDNPPLPSTEYIVGSLALGFDLQSVDFVPDLPLNHVFGAIEDYFFSVLDGGAGVRDLTGNELDGDLLNVRLTLDATAPTERSGGRLSRFTSADEEPPFGAGTVLPEWWGQHSFDLANGRIRPRPVTRFLSVADRSQPLPGVMTPFAPGLQTPLTNLGCKLQAMYRYADFGFDLDDESMHNIDVEGLSWAPAFGQVIADTFAQFEMRMSHGSRAPDEFIDPLSLFPAYPHSGLQSVYTDNLLEPTSYPQEVVHDRSRGYTVFPGDLFVVPSGTAMMPYPMNRGLPMSEWRTYTWRDTSIPARAGADNAGVPPRSSYPAQGLPEPANPFYPSGDVQTIGLPLVMEFRTFPDAGALGLNAFDVSLAVNSSSRPYFRAFSAGGINTSGQPVLVDPDLEDMANGGFNPGSIPPGQATFGRDPSYYIGAADMVVRVSRSYSLWFAALDPSTQMPFADPAYSPFNVEPAAGAQPEGTSVSLAFRGTDAVGNVEAETDAKTLDSYGDHYLDSIVTPPNQPDHRSSNANLNAMGSSFLTPVEAQWSTDPSSIATKSYYQVRITFESNIVTGLGPQVTSIGAAWQQ